jgi:hypothetical protein
MWQTGENTPSLDENFPRYRVYHRHEDPHKINDAIAFLLASVPFIRKVSSQVAL